ncbi:uncharacterized protein DS421_19g644660 [Arachis hypogaea]|uniref:Uncharacterized protein n=1 Tax=Arachis hypogaea TaxID=3818 RepID=A0A6B9V549_ARAHY|nr:uncharacterized protein DS421_19g644660 [Arachis hypogaea]
MRSRWRWRRRDRSTERARVRQIAAGGSGASSLQPYGGKASLTNGSLRSGAGRGGKCCLNRRLKPGRVELLCWLGLGQVVGPLH